MARNKLAGQPRPPEVREKISRGQQERYARSRSGPTVPDRKQCPRCKRWLPCPREFGWRKAKLKSGGIVWHPRSWCKDCTNAKSKAYRDKLRAEGTLQAKQRKWNKKRRKKNLASERRYQSRLESGHVKSPQTPKDPPPT